jgi:hypothetical protein
MGEAQDRYLSEIGKDCEGVRGPGVKLLAVQREDRDDGVRLVVRYQLEGTACESTATGETAVAAHAKLRDRILLDRVRLGFTAWVERPAS